MEDATSPVEDNSQPGSSWIRKLLFLPPLLLGIAILLWALLYRSEARERAEPIPPPTVRVFEIKPVKLLPRMVGYGRVRPVRSWRAVSQVSGRITYRHPRLKKGEALEKGTVIFRIDTEEYEIQREDLEGELQAVKAQLEEIDVTKSNLDKLLVIEKKNLKWYVKDIADQKALLAKKATSRQAYEQQLRNKLQQENRLQSLQNQANLIPSQRKLLVAKQARITAQIKKVDLLIKRAVISVPYDVNTVEVMAEEKQFVTPGQVLAHFDGRTTMEVEAQIWKGVKPLFGFEELPNPEQLSVAFQQFVQEYGLKIFVRWKFNQRSFTWPAQFSRFANKIDPQTRSFGVIVEVRDAHLWNNKRKPLLKGMYCEVEFQAKPRKKVVIVPRNALHKGEVVYLAREGKLVKQKVVVDFFQPEFAVIEKGLSSGDQVILSSVVPAASGRAVTPQLDRELMAALYEKARGGDK